MGEPAPWFGDAACLPLPKIYEFRIVCRTWASHLSSPCFLQTWSAHLARRHEESCLVMAQYSHDWLQGCLSEKTLIAYFPSLCRYVSLPLHSTIQLLSSSIVYLTAEAISKQGMSLTSDSLPMKLPSIMHDDTRTLDFSSISVKTMASAGGLICTIVHMHYPRHRYEMHCHDRNIINDLRDYTVLVFNPLNGSVKVLPSPKRPISTLFPSMSTHMLVDPNLLSYKVFLQSNDVCRFSLQVYDSLEGSWTSKDPPSVRSCTPYGTAHADLHFWDNAHKTIYGYHVYADRWSKVLFNTEGKGLFSRENLTWFANFESPCIMAYKGRLIFALIIWKMLKTHSTGFVVYELQVSKDGYPLHWEKIAQTPEQMLEESFYKESMSLSCNPTVSLVHHQKFIYMMCSCTKSDALKDKLSKRPRGGQFRQLARQLLNPIAYDLESDKWTYIPSYKGRHDMAGLFSCNLTFDNLP